MILPHILSPMLEHLGVVVGIRFVDAHCVASRKIENDNVAALNVAESLEPVIIKLWMLNVALESEQLVLCQREVQRSLWNSRSINHLIHPQEIACEQ